MSLREEVNSESKKEPQSIDVKRENSRRPVMERWPFLSFLILASFKVLYFRYMGALPVWMSMNHMPEMLTEARREARVSWNYNYRSFEATILLLGIEPRSSAKAATAFNFSVISLASLYHHNFESRYGGSVDWEPF